MSTPIIPWMGGKRRLAKFLLPMFPAHDCYVEAFAGGAALFFLRGQPAKVEVLNDINGELVNLYRVLQHHLEEFVRMYKWAISSRQMFEWHAATPPKTLTDIQRAARFFYLQQHAFGARIEGQTFGTATTTPPPNWMRIEEQLTAAHLRLYGVYIEHLPWQKIFEKYDRAHTLFYCDPPYWDTEGYGVPFEFSNYTEMAELMRTCKGKVIVSINDHPEIREAFKGLPMNTVDIKYSVGGGGKSDVVQELVITNFEELQTGGLFG